MPEFSIIIPVYNRPKLIERAITSVLSQSFNDFELIVIDDGSTDDTGSVVDALGQKDNRIKVVHQQNQGRCVARNSGLDLAIGRWICFLDSDDFYYPNHLDVIQNGIKTHLDEMAFATRLKTGIGRNRKLNESTDRKVILDDFAQDNPISILQVSFNRDFLVHHQIRFETESELKIAEDLLFLRSVLAHKPIFKLGALTAEIGEHSERSMNTEGIAEIIRCNHLSTEIFLARNKVNEDIANQMKIYSHRLAADLWLDVRNFKNTKEEIRKLLKINGAFFHARTIWTLSKYLKKSVLG